MKSSFRRNLLAGFGISLFLLITTSVASYYSITNLIDSADMVDHTHKVIMNAEDVISNLKDAETGQRGFLLFKDPAYLGPYTGSYERSIKALDRVKDLTVDNLRQQFNVDTLRLLVNQRFAFLQQAIDDARMDRLLNKDQLDKGRLAMDQVRLMVIRIQTLEDQLLAQRTAKLKQFTNSTPILIIAAAVLSLLITGFFFKRVSDDFRERALLNDALKQKDIETADRINIIQGIAKKVSEGDYTANANIEQNDALGSLSGSLNKMSNALSQSFGRLADNEWLQTGLARLGEKIAGEKDVPALAAELIQFVTEYTGSLNGALYIDDGGKGIMLASTHALVTDKMKQRFKSGEGIIGQTFKSNKFVLTDEIDETLFTSFGSGEIKPRSIIAYPLTFEGRVTGVIELSSIRSFRDLDIQYLSNISEVVGTVINTAYNRTKLKELLEETQSQSEELQAQHRELENMNVELETQAEKLQTSEEELKVQQEELMETNQALEERSRLLEERNHVIAMRNLDIQKKSEELELSTKYKSEFLANMSHELRTPLNSILLLSRLLGENNLGNLDPEQVEYAQVIRSSGNNLLQLIDEILDLSKIESGKLELSLEEVDVAEIVAELKMLFLPIAREKSLEFTIKVSPEVPARIETDKLRMGQVLKNLISNALKFTAKGSVDLEITPSKLGEGFVAFSVKDTGIGIPADKHDAIFEAFQQADGSTKRHYGGTGLGLSISRQLARLMGGDIMLISEPGNGSEFTLYTPISRAHALTNASTQDDESVTATTTIQQEPEKPVANKLLAKEIPAEIPDDRDNIKPGDNVLMIVEDDTAFAKSLLEFVRQKGYKGVVVVRGDKAIEMANALKPGGILLDVQLPVKDGLQVMDELKSHPATRHIPVHMMSSFNLKKESIGKGAVDFIYKPVLSEQMNSVLAKIESVVKNENKKVLIVEDNTQHAKALAYFLSNNGIKAEMTAEINEGIESLRTNSVNCVILDMGVPAMKSYEALDELKKNDALANIPIIIFTGKSLSRSEEQRIRQYADSIVIKTAHSYQRILDEVSLFLHLMDERTTKTAAATARRMPTLDNVLKNKTVLVTDDDMRNIFALTKALEKYQMRVIATTDGKEALQALNNNPNIDIVLMDMMMPEMDGYETISRIRQEQRWKRLPIISVTAKAMTGDREKCIQAGASDYITKPVDADQLVSLMRIWLQEAL